MREPASRSCKYYAKYFFRNKGYVSATDSQKNVLSTIKQVEPYLDRLFSVYEQLEDKASRDTVINVLAYSTLGKKMIKLPLNTLQYWANIEEIEKYADKNDFIELNFLIWKLYRLNFTYAETKTSIYDTSKAIFTHLSLQQYRCVTDNSEIKVEPGDCIIDAGACRREASPYFFLLPGETGSFYCFESTPSNVEILRNNLGFNSGAGKRIKIIEHPLWDEVATDVYYCYTGPASNVTLEKNKEYPDHAKTLTIGQLVLDKSLEHTGFIKMDIEGAELRPLEGAINTPKNFNRTLLLVYITHFLTLLILLIILIHLILVTSTILGILQFIQKKLFFLPSATIERLLSLWCEEYTTHKQVKYCFLDENNPIQK